MYETLTVFAGELASRKTEDNWGTCGLDDFIDAFYDSIKDTKIDCFETLERYGVEMSDRGLEACDVEHANAELVRALILTLYNRTVSPRACWADTPATGSSIDVCSA